MTSKKAVVGHYLVMWRRPQCGNLAYEESRYYHQRVKLKIITVSNPDTDSRNVTVSLNGTICQNASWANKGDTFSFHDGYGEVEPTGDFFCEWCKA